MWDDELEVIEDRAYLGCVVLIGLYCTKRKGRYICLDFCVVLFTKGKANCDTEIPYWGNVWLSSFHFSGYDSLQSVYSKVPNFMLGEQGLRGITQSAYSARGSNPSSGYKSDALSTVHHRSPGIALFMSYP